MCGSDFVGGDGQPQTQAALFTRHVLYRQPLEEAVDQPRWLLGRTWGEDHRGLRLEARFGEGVARELAARGHENVSLVDDWTDVGPRFLERIPDGKYAGFTIADFLPGLIQEYYRLSGRDDATGRPFKEMLQRLGLEEFGEWSESE